MARGYLTFPGTNDFRKCWVSLRSTQPTTTTTAADGLG